MATAPTFVGTPKIGLAQILPADTTSAKTVVTAGASGSKITGIVATSTDTVARVVTLSLVRSAVSYPLGAVTVALASGTDGVTPTTTFLGTTLLPGIPVDNDGQPYLFMQSGDTLTVASAVTVTAAKAVAVTAVYGDF